MGLADLITLGIWLMIGVYVLSWFVPWLQAEAPPPAPEDPPPPPNHVHQIDVPNYPAGYNHRYSYVDGVLVHDEVIVMDREAFDRAMNPPPPQPDDTW